VTPPDAWETPEPEWVNLAPGVRWLLRRPNGIDERVVAAETAAVMARVYEGRAALQDLGLDVDGVDASPALDLERLSGQAQVFAACLHARRLLAGWEGIEHPTSGEPLDHTDPANVQAALIYGPPPQGASLLSPFLAWLNRPLRPMASEGVRLKARAKDWWSGGAERCRACADESTPCSKGGAEPSADDPTRHELCPLLTTEPRTAEGQLAWSIATTGMGLWQRAGIGGAITGFDYGAALKLFESARRASSSECDVGAAFVAFRAIEAGTLEAMAAKAEAEEAARPTEG
jgi:hypothetical protein